VFCSPYIYKTGVIEDNVQGLQCHEMWLFFMARNVYAHLKSLRLFVTSVVGGVVFFCKLKSEKLAETIIRGRCRESGLQVKQLGVSRLAPA